MNYAFMLTYVLFTQGLCYECKEVIVCWHIDLSVHVNNTGMFVEKFLETVPNELKSGSFLNEGV